MVGGPRRVEPARHARNRRDGTPRRRRRAARAGFAVRTRAKAPVSLSRIAGAGGGSETVCVPARAAHPPQGPAQAPARRRLPLRGIARHPLPPPAAIPAWSHRMARHRTDLLTILGSKRLLLRRHRPHARRRGRRRTRQRARQANGPLARRRRRARDRADRLALPRLAPGRRILALPRRAARLAGGVSVVSALGVVLRAAAARRVG